MDRDSWAALSDKVAPILKQLKQIAFDFKLGDEPLSIGVFADGIVWATFIDNDNTGAHFDVEVRSNGATYMSDTLEDGERDYIKC